MAWHRTARRRSTWPRAACSCSMRACGRPERRSWSHDHGVEGIENVSTDHRRSGLGHKRSRRCLHHARCRWHLAPAAQSNDSIRSLPPCRKPPNIQSLGAAGGRPNIEDCTDIPGRPRSRARVCQERVYVQRARFRHACHMVSVRPEISEANLSPYCFTRPRLLVPDPFNACDRSALNTRQQDTSPRCTISRS